MTDIERLPVDPIWRQAAIDAVDEFEYGDIIPWEWLTEALQLSRPNTLLTPEQFQSLQFEQLTRVDGFRDEMLTQYERYLINVRGIGYKIVEPPHQTREAMVKLHRELRKSVAAAMEALVNINSRMLSLDDSRENADARAKVAAFNRLHVKNFSGKNPPSGPLIEKK